jgi:hypothetical protein
MLIATHAVALALLFGAAPSASLPPVSAPPMTVSVWTAGDVSPSLVKALLAETDTIFRGTGLQFVWQRPAREAKNYSRTASNIPYVPLTLRVSIGHDAGKGGESESRLPLGWITFEDPTTPDQDIYLSYENALTLLRNSPGVVGNLNNMPRAEIETYLGRAMGRALAHEIGHYLSASKVHSEKGLMMAVHSAYDLFNASPMRWQIDGPLRDVMALHVRGDAKIAAR